GGVGGRPAAAHAVALITTAGFWATCAAVAQPGRAAVSYVQANTPAPKELQVGGSKPSGGSSSQPVGVRPNDSFVNCRSGVRISASSRSASTRWWWTVAYQ